MAMELDAAIDEVVGALEDNPDEGPDEELEVDLEADEEPDPDLEDVEDDDELPEGDEELDDEDDEPDDEESDGEAGERLEVSEDDEIVLPDGSVVTVKDAALRQADYTRKTQELADQRREFESERDSWSAEREELETVHEQMRTWLEEKSSDPAGWAREIAAETDNPTRTIAEAIVALNDEGLLDPKFAEQFNLDVPDSPVRQSAHDAQEDDRLTRLERDAEARREAEQADIQRRDRVRQMFDSWDQLKVEQGLKFESDEDEHEARLSTLRFAIENGLTDRLGIAHDALTARGSTKSSTTSGAKQVPAKKKRATRAMAAKSSGSSTKATPKKAKTVEGAAELALDEFLAG